MNPRKVNEHDEAAYGEAQKLVMRPPHDMPNCDDLETLIVEDVLISFWKPTEEELKLLNNGSSIELSVFGGGMPPVQVSVTDYV
jgi:hypothetical protein